MNQTKFVVGQFKNRNGTTSWRVSGWLSGERIRKNFKTREEAAAEKAALEISAEQATSGLRSIVTCLTAEQVRDAEAAVRRIGSKGHSLTFCVDYALNNYRVPENEKLLLDAVTEYQAVKQVAYEKTLLSIRQLRSIKNELTTFSHHFPKTRVSEITVAKLLQYLIGRARAIWCGSLSHSLQVQLRRWQNTAANWCVLWRSKQRTPGSP